MKIIITRQFVFGAIFVAIVLGGRLLYMCDLKASRPSEVARIHWTSRDMEIRSESTWRPQPSTEARWGQLKGRYGERALNSNVQFFMDQGFRESTSRAMAEEMEKDIERRIRSRSW